MTQSEQSINATLFRYGLGELSWTGYYSDPQTVKAISDDALQQEVITSLSSIKEITGSEVSIEILSEDAPETVKSLWDLIQRLEKDVETFAEKDGECSYVISPQIYLPRVQCDPYSHSSKPQTYSFATAKAHLQDGTSINIEFSEMYVAATNNATDGEKWDNVLSINFSISGATELGMETYDNIILALSKKGYTTLFP